MQSLYIFLCPPFRLPFSSLKTNGESQIVQEFVREGAHFCWRYSAVATMDIGILVFREGQ